MNLDRLLGMLVGFALGAGPLFVFASHLVLRAKREGRCGECGRSLPAEPGDSL